MEKPRYGLFQPLCLSFYSSALYRDVAKRWQGTGLAYLLMLLALSCLISSGLLYTNLLTILKHAQAVAAHSVPTIYIKKGVVSIDEASPFRIRVPGEDKPFIVIDTRDKPLNLAQSNSEILITQTQVLTNNEHNNTIETHVIPKTASLVIDQGLFEWLASKLQLWLPVFYFFGLLIVSFIYRALQSLLYVLLLRVIAHFYDVELSFDETLRLTIVALTPAIMLATLLDILSWHSTYVFWLAYFFLTLGYLVFAVKSNQRRQGLEI